MTGSSDITPSPAEVGVQGPAWDRYRYRVAGTAAVSPVIRRLMLEPVAKALPYLAGQYVLLSDAEEDQIRPRSYSVANARRGDGCVSLLVTRIDGGSTSTWAHRLRIGEEVVLEGPYGTFVDGGVGGARTGPRLLLAAGSGLAPARALAEAALQSRPGPGVTLFFSARTRADALDRAQFEAWQRDRTDFRYLLTLTRDARARLHARIPDLLASTVGDLHGWEVFTSGPPGFVAGCASAARALGAAPSRVHTEEFFADPQPWD